MHARGWRSIYCIPDRPAFKGSAPINLTDRLNQVLRWALGSVEILFSRHCPMWYGYGGRLKWLERFAYINTTIYPITSIPLLAYCTLPAICLLTGKFIIPQVKLITVFLEFISKSLISTLKNVFSLRNSCYKRVIISIAFALVSLNHIFCCLFFFHYRLAILPVSGLFLSFFPSLPLVFWK